MSDCEFYERLISDSCDQSLSPDQLADLEKHLATCSNCQAFAESVTLNTLRLRGLPTVPADNAESAAESRFVPKARSRFRERSVSVPLPAAAVLLAMLVGFAAYGGYNVWNTFGCRPGDAPGLHDPLTRIEYVQIERLRPVSARLVTGK